jgi:hypothetical protein
MMSDHPTDYGESDGVFRILTASLVRFVLQKSAVVVTLSAPQTRAELCERENGALQHIRLSVVIRPPPDAN